MLLATARDLGVGSVPRGKPEVARPVALHALTISASILVPHPLSPIYH